WPALCRITPPPATQQPDPSAGQRRPPTASSSPNSKGEKETQQPKKKVRPMSVNPRFETQPMTEDQPDMQIPNGKENTTSNGEEKEANP
ncbi:unnamed protein product, partial [Linum tenue]